jgi:hypothetical protein
MTKNISRRDFLKSSLLMGGALAVGPLYQETKKAVPDYVSHKVSAPIPYTGQDPDSPFQVVVREDDNLFYYEITGTHNHPFEEYYQGHGLTCALGATTIVLEALYQGSLSQGDIEDTLLEYVTPSAGMPALGNPDLAFRGDPNGGWGDISDYGINAMPVQNAVIRFLQEHPLPEGVAPITPEAHYDYAFREFSRNEITQEEMDARITVQSNRVADNIRNGYPTSLWQSLMGPPGMVRWISSAGEMSFQPRDPAWGVIIDRMHCELVIGVTTRKVDGGLNSFLQRSSAGGGDDGSPLVSVQPHPLGWKELDLMTLTFHPPA